MAKGYNFIYDQLVDSEDDIHGIISYSVYKRQKIQFIKSFKGTNGDDEPSEEDLKPFNALSMSDSQLEFYKSEATVLTQSFLKNVLDADLKEREAYFSARVHAELNDIKPRHLLDIFKGALGSLLFVILTGVLYFAVWSLSTSPKMVIEQIFEVQITSLEETER
ncbi:hypothetical protein V6257_12190 [Pseudoalteromonas issachenkonii]|uniref:Uncharacterized protein n=1 Tax=Pseudoalteromonas issachenkonii TaxID=152297 RepID=A0ABU9H1R0_9GAMM